MFHSKSSAIFHVGKSMVVESDITRYMCNYLLVIKSDSILKDYCVLILYYIIL